MSGRLEDLPPGHVGAVVTFLEMHRPPPSGPIPQSRLTLEHWSILEPERYRNLFRRVGEKWLWFSRLAMTDEALLSAAGEVHVVIDPTGSEVGLIELDFAQDAGECLIRFLGLVPELAGQGHGRWLFGQTLALAWRPGVGRLRVHTCSLDHPAALPSYLRAGFKPYKRAFECFPDPRLAGLLPRSAAPQIPILD